VAKKIPDAIKAKGIALLLAGGTIGGVAKELGLSKGTVQRWHDSLKNAASDSRMHTENTAIQVQTPTVSDGRMHTVHTQKKSIAERVFNLLDAQLETLTVQQAHFQDKTWLNRQSAADMAMLHGVLSDKALRMMEAAERASKRPPPSQTALPLDDGTSETEKSG